MAGRDDPACRTQAEALEQAKDDRAILAAEVIALKAQLAKLKGHRRRGRTAARAAGSKMEKVTVEYLAAHVDDRIERRKSNGAKDRGDVSSVRVLGGGRMVLECKDTTTGLDLGVWYNEALVEMGNDDAIACAIVHKAHGKAAGGEQWVTMKLVDLVVLLTGQRPGIDNSDTITP